ncbi:glucagon-1-like [Stigmatopora nigra]
MSHIYSLIGLLVILSIVQSSWQVPLQDLTSSEPHDNLERRHSERLFTNDFSRYIEDRIFEDFIRNNKRSGSMGKRHAEGTFTSDVSSYLQDQALRDFVGALMSGQIRREWDVTMRGQRLNMRRHVDGSFTSDVNKVLDSMAAKEFLLWVMASKSSGES